MVPEKGYDVFISYAIEDKISIANELAKKLTDQGLKVWYAAFELSVGSSVSETISEGLTKARFGIVILSPNYFKKRWPMRELTSLLALQARDKCTVLPVWHNITYDEILDVFPAIADPWGIPTDKGVDFVVDKLLGLIKEGKSQKPVFTKKKRNWRKFAWAAVLVAALYFLFQYFMQIQSGPGKKFIRETVDERISKFENKIDTDLKLLIDSNQGRESTLDELTGYFDQFSAIDAHYRNYYEYSNQYIKLQFKKNLDGLHIDLSTNSPQYAFGFTEYSPYLIRNENDGKELKIIYAIKNKSPVDYEIKDQTEIDDITYQITVSYTNNIRYVSSDLNYSQETNYFRRNQMTYLGFKPTEIYVFKNNGVSWVLDGVE